MVAAVDSRAEGALVGVGDFEFYLDMASLPTGGAETLELFQIAVPSKEVEYDAKKGRYHAAVRIQIELRTGEGEVVHSKGYVIRDDRDEQPMAEDLSSFFFLLDSCYTEPGDYVLKVKVEDAQRRKKTLFGLLGKKYLSSLLDNVAVTVRSFPADEISLADPILVWSMMQREEGVAFIPNPIQIFGLKNDSLSFFTRALVPPSFTADSLDIYLSVLNTAGELQADEGIAVPVVDRRANIFGSFDLNTYPSGTYRIRVEAFDQSGIRSVSGKDFSVAWELINWQKARRDILVEARFLLSNDEYQMFERMNIGDQERMMNEFWRAIDPTPNTALNETYETFMQRLRYADARFGGDERGALSDRGRLYIRFGPPDDIVHQTVPKTREDMTEALEKLEDEYKVIAFGSSRGPGSAEYPRVQSRTLLGTRMSDGIPFRGVGMDLGAFELWIYDLRGEPLLERDRIMTVQSGLRFLFVDKDGIGEFRLIGTSEEIQETE